jgi:hypothetical protein
VNHEVRAGEDEVELRFEFKNDGTEAVPIQWFQPACIRVDRFTGFGQSNYTSRSFIFTERGLTTLDKTRRTEDALYRGGQVYVPAGVNLSDANPRPICRDQPTNGLIGCFSADGKMLLATASDSTHELFEGVYVCLHSDPRVGGLAAGKSKIVRAKIYFLPNDTEALLKRYQKDFPNENLPNPSSTALRLVTQRVVHQHQCGHGFHHRHGARQYAGIVTATALDRRVV